MLNFKKIMDQFNIIRFKSVFFKYFFVFVFLIILPVALLGSVAYKGFYNNLKEIGKANANTLNKTLESIDIVLSNIEKQTNIYSSDPYMVKYLVNPESISINMMGNIYNQIKTISEMDYVQSVYLYNAYNNSVISSEDGFNDFETFYDPFWMDIYKTKEDTRAWLDTRKVVNAEGESYNCITLVRSLPYSTKSPLGAIVINLDEDKLSELLSKQYHSEALMYIVNEKNIIISHPDKSMLYKSLILPIEVKEAFDKDIGYYITDKSRGNTIYAMTKSQLMGWKYICEISALSLMEGAEKTKKVTVTVILLYMIFGLFFAYFMARRFYSPIKNLMTQIDYKMPGRNEDDIGDERIQLDEYAYLEESYNYLLGVNSNLENSLKQTMPVILDKYISDILQGKKIVEVDLIKKLLKKYHVNIQLMNFFVIVLKFNMNDLYSENNKEEDVIKQNLIKICKDTINTRSSGYVTEVNYNMLALIVNVDQEEKMNMLLKEVIDEIKSKINNLSNVRVTFGVGNFYQYLNDIRFSYNEALKALSNEFYYGYNSVIRYKQIQDLGSNVSYESMMSEQKFANYILVKDIKGIEKLVNNIIDHIIKNRIDEQLVKQLFSKLCINLIEGMVDEQKNLYKSSIDMNHIFNVINHGKTLEDIKQIIMDMFEVMISDLQGQTINPHIEGILNYIHKNFQQDISLNSVSEAVSLSPQYISKIFREHMNKNFTEYLALYRLDKAKNILRNEDIPLSELIKLVGFNNLQTFLRTFKKYEGITPGQYKKRSAE